MRRRIYVPSTEPMLRINADEYGLNTYRDRGIVACFRRDAIHSASLIVTGDTAKSAAQQAKTMGLPLNLHLKFQGEDVATETREQLDLFKEWFGHYPSRVDGFQDAHVAKGVPEKIAPVLQKAGVVFTRIPDEDISIIHWIDDDVRTRYESRYLRGVNARLVYAHHGISAPDKTYDIGLRGEEMTLKRIQHILATVEGNIELVVHPGFCLLDGENKGHLHECRVLNFFQKF